MKRRKKESGPKIVNRVTQLSKIAGEGSIEHIQENVVERISHIKNVRLLIIEWVLMVGIIIFLAITQAFWYADSYAAVTYTKGGTYTEATLGKINSLNPLFASTSSEKALSRLMFSTLSAPDYSGHTGLDLASSIRTDDTGKVWTIKLRENLKWSDGEPITNRDVIYTINTIQNPNVNTSYASNLSGVKLTEKDGALVFTLPSAYANFSSALNIPILPKHVLKDVDPELLLEDGFSNTPVTSGPFTYNATQAIGTEGEKVVYLSPNPAYYKGAPLLTSFAVHAYLTEEDIARAINSGSATATAEISPANSGQITNSSIYEKQSALSSGVYAFFNTGTGIFNNKTLRRAVRQGINLENIRADLPESALDYPILTTQIDLADFPKLPAANFDAAKKTIAAAKLPEDTTINLATISTGNLPTIADRFASELQALGFKVAVQVHEPNQDFLLGVIRPRAYDILIYEVELGPDPDLFAYYHSSQASESGLNLSNYRSQLTDDAILGARSTMDVNLRAAKYQTFLSHWVDDAPAIGICQSNLAYFVNRNVRSFSEDNRLVYPTDRFVDVYHWAAERTVKNRTP